MVHAPGHVLIVEDDFGLRRVLEKTLRGRAYQVFGCDSAETALDLYNMHRFDMFVVAKSLPGMGGEELIKALRKKDSRIGLIVISKDKRQGSHNRCFNLGVDDYFDKPFPLQEFLNRVQALMRRTRRGVRLPAPPGSLMLCFSTQRAWVDRTLLSLSAMEMDLLQFLAKNADKPISRNELLDEIWGMESTTGPRSVDAFISILRRKIRQKSSLPIIQSVHGVAYRLKGEFVTYRNGNLESDTNSRDSWIETPLSHDGINPWKRWSLGTSFGKKMTIPKPVESLKL